jgi:hypothetical protein
MRTQIAYMTADEVNHTLALGMARECGARLVRAPLGGNPPAGTGIARLHDLDHVPEQQREAILADLLSRPTVAPVAVHSYNLREDEAASLRANGVIVARALDPTLVRRLGQASEPAQELAAVELDRDESEEELIEPATLCALVRSLASQAHRTLRRTPSAPDEINDVRLQLADLRRQFDQLRRSHALQFDELERWLENLMKRVEDRYFEASA